MSYTDIYRDVNLPRLNRPDLEKKVQSSVSALCDSDPRSLREFAEHLLKSRPGPRLKLAQSSPLAALSKSQSPHLPQSAQ